MGNCAWRIWKLTSLAVEMSHSVNESFLFDIWNYRKIITERLPVIINMYIINEWLTLRLYLKIYISLVLDLSLPRYLSLNVCVNFSIGLCIYVCVAKVFTFSAEAVARALSFQTKSCFPSPSLQPLFKRTINTKPNEGRAV